MQRAVPAYLPLLAHLSIRLSFILEYRIPTEGPRATCRHDLTFSPTLEERDFLIWSAAVRKGADSIGCLVRVSDEEVVETGMAEGGQEVLSASVRYWRSGLAH